MGSIFNMFGPSPINQLERHMRKAHLCAKQLIPFFDAVMANQWEQALQSKERIVELEKEADVIKRDLRLNLPGGLLLPFSRTGLLEVLHAQDAIANKTEHIADLVVSRQMLIPHQLSVLLSTLVDRAIDASRQACEAINELDELLESGFRGSEVKVVEKMVKTLDTIEQDCDTQLATIRKAIFLLEHDLPAIEVIFLYKLVQWIGDLADQAQKVGILLQTLIVR